MNTSLNRKSFLFKPDVQIVFKNLVEHLLSIAKSNFLMLFMEVVALYCRSHISFLVGSGLSTHCSCRWLLLCLTTFRHTHTHTHTHTLGNSPLDGGSALRLGLYLHVTTFSRDERQCLRPDSNPQSQEARGSRRVLQTARPPGSACRNHTKCTYIVYGECSVVWYQIWAFVGLEY